MGVHVNSPNVLVVCVSSVILLKIESKAANILVAKFPRLPKLVAGS